MPGMDGTLANDDVTLGDLAATQGTRTTLDVDDAVGTLLVTNGNEFATGNFEITADSANVTTNGILLLTPRNGGGW